MDTNFDVLADCSPPRPFAPSLPPLHTFKSHQHDSKAVHRFKNNSAHTGYLCLLMIQTVQKYTMQRWNKTTKSIRQDKKKWQPFVVAGLKDQWRDAVLVPAYSEAGRICPRRPAAAVHFDCRLVLILARRNVDPKFEAPFLEYVKKKKTIVYHHLPCIGRKLLWGCYLVKTSSY